MQPAAIDPTLDLCTRYPLRLIKINDTADKVYITKGLVSLEKNKIAYEKQRFCTVIIWQRQLTKELNLIILIS